MTFSSRIIITLVLIIYATFICASSVWCSCKSLRKRNSLFSTFAVGGGSHSLFQRHLAACRFGLLKVAPLLRHLANGFFCTVIIIIIIITTLVLVSLRSSPFRTFAVGRALVACSDIWWCVFSYFLNWYFRAIYRTASSAKQ
jgi:hypothetical protein